ncbi:MAG: hypothetical protein R2755_29520 [Acidimicrobiales bacterium]
MRKINVNTELRRAYFEQLAAGLAADAGRYDLPAVFGAAGASVATAAAPSSGCSATASPAADRAGD